MKLIQLFQLSLIDVVFIFPFNFNLSMPFCLKWIFYRQHISWSCYSQDIQLNKTVFTELKYGNYVLSKGELQKDIEKIIMTIMTLLWQK